MIEFDEVNKRLLYDSLTGLFLWRVKPVDKPTDKAWNKKYAHSNAGSNDGKGYLKIAINNRKYYSHRLAWLLYYGEWPSFTIDHVNGNTSDNRIQNLRDVPHKENMRNMRKSRANTTGEAGVWFNKNSKTWCVNLSTDWVGSFATKDEATKARREAAAKSGYHYNHGTTR